MNKFLVILSFILIVLSGYMFYKLKERDGAENGSTVTSDTIYVNHTDTIIKTKLVPKNVYVDKIITDTLLSVDSIPVEINIPISKQFFCDTVTVDKDTAIISSVISGYDINYDSLSVILKLSEKIVTNTIKPKKYHFVIGPTVGLGYSSKGGVQPFIGVSIVFPLWKF